MFDILNKFANQNDRELAYQYIQGINYLIDLRDKKIAEQYYAILKTYLAGSRLPSAKRNTIDEFINKIYSLDSSENLNSEIINKNTRNRELERDSLGYDKAIKQFEKGLDFEAPGIYRSSAIVSFIGNLALDNYIKPIQFSYITNTKKLKENEYLFNKITEDKNDGDIYKVILTFENYKKNENRLFPSVEIYRNYGVSKDILFNSPIGINESYEQVKIDTFETLFKYFENFLKDSSIKISTPSIGQRLFFARRYLAGFSQVELSKQIGTKVTRRTIGNWEESEEKTPLWSRKNFGSVIEALYIPFMFLLMKDEDDFPDTIAYEILHDWLSNGDSKRNRHELPEIIKNFTFEKNDNMNSVREQSFEDFLYKHNHKGDTPPSYFVESPVVDVLSIQNWTYYFSEVEEDTLFELMDIMRLKREEQEIIHKIFWYINSGNDNTRP